MEAQGPGYGRLAVIVLAGLALVGDLIFAVRMAGDFFS
jgi:hypothetical protein